MSSPLLLVPYVLGPPASHIGGFEDTVLIPTFAMPMPYVLRYAAVVAARGATALLLRSTCQPMPQADDFDKMGLPGCLLLTVPDEYAAPHMTDGEKWADLERSINYCSMEIDVGFQVSDEEATPLPLGHRVPDLTAEERLEFLRGFYSARNEDGP